jgi:hypothetical protein
MCAQVLVFRRYLRPVPIRRWDTPKGSGAGQCVTAHGADGGFRLVGRFPSGKVDRRRRAQE